ncbi:MAG: DUF5677 domain-containing protein [candidate division Zixibacteria bacterium]|nr:DUF5677 domain-containing protein [candidate division Zixibacteria bacterium]
MNERLIPLSLKKDYVDFSLSSFFRYKDHLDLSYNLFNTLFEIIEKNEDKIAKNLDSNFNKAITLLFYQSFRIYWSILALCEEGFGTQSAILLRSLMERVIDIEWMAKLDISEREVKAKAFLDFEIIASKQLMDKYEKYDIYSKMDEKTKKVLINNRATILEKYSEIKGDYPKNKEDFIFRWASESYKKKAEQVSKAALKDYDFYYWYLSFVTHSTTMGDVKYFEQCEMPLHGLFCLSIKYILLAFNRWDLVFSLGLGRVKKEFVNRLKSLNNPVKKYSEI